MPCGCKWSQRLEREGLAGLRDRPGRGRKPSLPAAMVRCVLKAASQAPPARARWSTRTGAAHLGLSHDTWPGSGAARTSKPHLQRPFELSRRPQFNAKFRDGIGLYFDPPEKSLVFCCDEKTLCQALERTQPSLPLGPGRLRAETRDFIRPSTITLFATLN